MQITLGNLHAPCTWALHVTSPRDPCIWPLCSSTQLVELSQLNTSSRFCQKHNFFEAPKVRSVSTWRITWFLLFTLTIPLNQPSVFVTRLTVFTLRPFVVWKSQYLQTIYTYRPKPRTIKRHAKQWTKNNQITNWKHLFSETENNQMIKSQVNEQLRLTAW